MKIFLNISAVTLFFVSAILWVAVYYLSKSMRTYPDESSLKIVYFLIRAFQLFIISGWLWTVGLNLDNVLPADLKDMKIQIFKTILSLYFLVGIIESILFTMNNGHKLFHPISYLLLYNAVVLTLHIYFAFFIAKELKSIELQRVATWDDYTETFFLLIFFYPIGIWWVQPRINKIFAKKNE